MSELEKELEEKLEKLRLIGRERFNVGEDGAFYGKDAWDNKLADLINQALFLGAHEEDANNPICNKPYIRLSMANGVIGDLEYAFR